MQLFPGERQLPSAARSGNALPEHDVFVAQRVGSRAESKNMTAESTTTTFGWRVYGLGMIALGMVCVAFGDFHPGQPVPKDFPDRTVLAYAAAAFMLVAGAAVEWRRTTAWGAAALAGYFGLIVVVLMNG